MTNQTAIQRLDDIASNVAREYGTDSWEYFHAMAQLDDAIEAAAISDDVWGDAEIRAMNGESL